MKNNNIYVLWFWTRACYTRHLSFNISFRVLQLGIQHRWVWCCVIVSHQISLLQFRTIPWRCFYFFYQSNVLNSHFFSIILIWQEIFMCVFVCACEIHKPNNNNNNNIKWTWNLWSFPIHLKILFMMLTLKYFYPLLSSRVLRQTTPALYHVCFACTYTNRSRSCQMYTLLNNNTHPATTVKLIGFILFSCIKATTKHKKSTSWDRFAIVQVH